ncbi:hypothetical protein L596_017528 [Steinernema carpocapsae]|uniref:Uncharacterized protein n=1 Tax=Steinernema carpocapsae TaxID=34508 RepID=A0A4V6A1R7_STECR|nr:hypothetical protein L596_017528 [Steinernema carpocapsae]
MEQGRGGAFDAGARSEIRTSRGESKKEQGHEVHEAKVGIQKGSHRGKREIRKRPVQEARKSQTHPAS